MKGLSLVALSMLVFATPVVLCIRTITHDSCTITDRDGDTLLTPYHTNRDDGARSGAPNLLCLIRTMDNRNYSC